MEAPWKVYLFHIEIKDIVVRCHLVGGGQRGGMSGNGNKRGKLRSLAGSYDLDRRRGVEELVDEYISFRTRVVRCRGRLGRVPGGE